MTHRSHEQSDVPMPSGWNRCAKCGGQYPVPGSHRCPPEVTRIDGDRITISVPGRMSFTILETKG